MRAPLCACGAVALRRCTPIKCLHPPLPHFFLLCHSLPPPIAPDRPGRVESVQERGHQQTLARKGPAGAARDSRACGTLLVAPFPSLLPSFPPHHSPSSPLTTAPSLSPSLPSPPSGFAVPRMQITHHCSFPSSRLPSPSPKNVGLAVPRRQIVCRRNRRHPQRSLPFSSLITAPFPPPSIPPHHPKT